MEIKLKSLYVNFEDLSVGDCFLYVDTVYMKIVEAKEVNIANTVCRNAVCLYDGTLAAFAAGEAVVPLKLKAVAERGTNGET